ncbi:MAG: GatB/YqeY domain-containing protein, partial [Candidatus Omnitrophota bacterium]|nr:GatB/YqeY domain-containing protein [Candidatus Omnitrophota bacterium]
DVLKTYLPPELSQDEISKIINEAAATTSAQGIKDMGRLMKEVNAKIAGHADPKLVSDMVRVKLSGPATQL